MDSRKGKEGNGGEHEVVEGVSGDTLQVSQGFEISFDSVVFY